MQRQISLHINYFYIKYKAMSSIAFDPSRLKAFRRHHRLTQAQLGRALGGMTQVAVAQWESAKHKSQPSGSALVLLNILEGRPGLVETALALGREIEESRK